MSMLASPAGLKADYGIDAPELCRLFLLGGGTGVVTGSIIWRLSDDLQGVWQIIAPMVFWPGLSFLLTGLAMVWGSKVGKLRLRDRILDQLHLTGDEQALDVGCGRGLMLLGLARRLSTGRGVGIDLWQAQDQSGNAITATEENARREGVAEKVELHTGDMRELPFENKRFDIVVSSWAIHNIPDVAGRVQAIQQIDRVLKPGGQLVIVDISYIGEYQKELHRLGWTDLKRVGPTFHFVIPSYQLWGRKP
ncbi:MAG TPA: class I SAM-dependent methyltransferase [Gemmatales bacterium]|nr:class I SAM-dependent methyltransferase [Gemmatales bacterium]